MSLKVVTSNIQANHKASHGVGIMLERDIQEYFYENPQVIFKTKEPKQKAKEYSINGKRIDLLFLVDDIYFIIELKRVPLAREHIGQVLEYYCMLKDEMDEPNLRMILAAPKIPGWAKHLKDIGIECSQIKGIGQESGPYLVEPEYPPTCGATSLTFTKKRTKPPSIVNPKLELGEKGEEWIEPVALIESEFIRCFSPATQRSITEIIKILNALGCECLVRRRHDNALIFVPKQLLRRKSKKKPDHSLAEGQNQSQNQNHAG